MNEAIPVPKAVYSKVRGKAVVLYVVRIPAGSSEQVRNKAYRALHELARRNRQTNTKKNTQTMLGV